MWRPAEEIIERLLSRSSRLPAQAPAPEARPQKDRYYRQARKAAALRAAANDEILKAVRKTQ